MEHRIHWTRGIAVLEVAQGYWAAGLVAIATELRVVITTAVTT